MVLHHHPFTRAAGTLWALEEAGCEYELEFVDLQGGEHKLADFKGRNPMGKLPTLVDGDAVVTEAAAIALYLGDRYAMGELAPPPDDPRRGAYLRWSFYAPSVVEPGCMAKAAKWAYQPGQAGWGTYEEMLDTMEAAIGEGPYLLGDMFSMADVVFGGTLRWMLQFKMLDARPAFVSYAERLGERPASKRAREINEKVREARGIPQR